MPHPLRALTILRNSSGALLALVVPFPLTAHTSPASLAHSSLSAALALIPRGVAPAFCVAVLLLPLSVSAPGCPLCAPTPIPLACPPPPQTRIARLRMTLTVPRAVGWSRPCCHPCGGHLLARGVQPPPLWSSRAPRKGRGGPGC